MCQIKRIIEIDLGEVQSPNYDSNLRKYGEDSNSCLICGKRIKEGKEKMVHLLISGNIVSYNGEDIEGSQGFFPVGPDCAKKLNNIVKFAF